MVRGKNQVEDWRKKIIETTDSEDQISNAINKYNSLEKDASNCLDQSLLRDIHVWPKLQEQKQEAKHKQTDKNNYYCMLADQLICWTLV